MIKKFKAVLLVLGLVMFSISIISLFITNFNLGIIIIFAASCIFILYGLFFERLIRIKLLTYSILLLGALFLILTVFIFVYGKNNNVTYNEDAVIVLGTGIRGEEVTRLLAYRLDKAIEYSTKNPNAVIVVSGGQGPQEDITEAEAMERYLLSMGMDKNKIVKEDASTSTHENLLYSKKILDDLLGDEYKVVVITNDFHIFRATKLAEKLGFNATRCGAKTDWYSIPLNYSRECLTVLKFLIFDNHFILLQS